MRDQAKPTFQKDGFNENIKDEEGYSLYEAKNGAYHRIYGWDWTTQVRQKEGDGFETKKRGGDHN